MRGIGIFVAAIEEFPVVGACARAVLPSIADSAFGYVRAILADLLALVVRERCEEFVEAGIALVLPAELDAVAMEDSRPGDRFSFRRFREQHVERRCVRLACELDRMPPQ